MVDAHSSTQTLPVVERNGARKLSMIVAIISTSVLVLSTVAGAAVYVRSVMVDRSTGTEKRFEKHDVRIRKVEEGQIRQEVLMDTINVRQQEMNAKLDRLLEHP